MRDDFKFVKLRHLKKENAETCSGNGLFYFGNAEIWLKKDCNINKNSYSYLGVGGYYELPDGIIKNTEEAKSYLAGSHNFKVLELEVYKLEWEKDDNH